MVSQREEKGKEEELKEGKERIGKEGKGIRKGGGESKRKKRKKGKVRGGVGICTVDPADGQRLEDGEKQQAGSTAGEMVIDLEHIQTTLHRS